MRRLEEQLNPGQNQQYCAILDEAHAWAGDAKMMHVLPNPVHQAQSIGRISV